MPEGLRVGIAGAGWPGQAHAKGYKEAAGCKIVAVADLIPDRRRKIMSEFGATKEFADASEMITDKEIDAISLCLPTHLHAAVAVAALKAGKHVLCEPPPCLNSKEAGQIERAAAKSGKTFLYAMQRRFGAAETASKAAIQKGYAGEIYHARASWLRTRGVPIGTGWYTEKSKSGGGALIDVGLHLLDLAWFLLGQPKPLTVFGVGYQKFKSLVDPKRVFDVEDSSFAIVKFEGNKSIELASSWALNQPPQQQGTLCRMFGEQGALDVYTPQGATIYRSFNDKGEGKATPLKPPKTIGHTALIRHFKDCILGKSQPTIGVKEGVVLMDVIDAIYKSAETGKSVNV
jgi:predicted dehydrogenase